MHQASCCDCSKDESHVHGCFYSGVILTMLSATFRIASSHSRAKMAAMGCHLRTAARCTVGDACRYVSMALSTAKRACMQDRVSSDFAALQLHLVHRQPLHCRLCCMQDGRVSYIHTLKDGRIALQASHALLAAHT